MSLFDGISCGRVALERAGIKVDKYYASEIEESAIKISQKNYPDIIQIGDINNVRFENGILYSDNGKFDIGSVDLILAGSPCQDLSTANRNGKGLEGQKSGLFFQFKRLLDEIKPRYFLLENVVPKKQIDKDTISELIGVQPVFINSKDFSAQSRSRLYWCNFDIQLPEDKCKDVTLDILEDDAVWTKEHPKWLDNKWGDRTRFERVTYCTGKANCLTATMYKGQISTYTRNDKGEIHKLTPVECERLQTLKDGYTDCVSNSDRYKAVGNGWTVDVIAHILKYLK